MLDVEMVEMVEMVRTVRMRVSPARMRRRSRARLDQDGAPVEGSTDVVRGPRSRLARVITDPGPDAGRPRPAARPRRTHSGGWNPPARGDGRPGRPGLFEGDPAGGGGCEPADP